MIEIRRTNREAVAVIEVAGRLDVTTLSPLDEAINEVFDSNQPALVIDCSELKYISSSGLRILLLAARRFGPRTVDWFCAASRVRFGRSSISRASHPSFQLGPRRRRQRRDKEGDISPTCRHAPIRMLVVDDEPDLQALIRQKFRRQTRENRYEFLFASDGAEALAVLEKRPDVELVLTDINMPRMDGLTLLSKLRDLDHPVLKAVIVSAYGDLQNIRKAMNEGAFDFLTKPIDLRDTTINKTLKSWVCSRSHCGFSQNGHRYNTNWRLRARSNKVSCRANTPLFRADVILMCTDR